MSHRKAFLITLYIMIYIIEIISCGPVIGTAFMLAGSVMFLIGTRVINKWMEK